jgi:hypothetical protein
MSYILFNPQVGGGIKSKQKSANSAAEEIWSKLSSNIKQYTPEFYFTIQEGGGDKLYHYKVEEVIESNRVKYTLSKLASKKSNDDKILNAIKQEGGRRKKRDDDSSSSSSSSSSSDNDSYVYYPRKRKSDNGINLTYYPSIYGVNNILLPTFASNMYPFVSLKFPLLNNIPFVIDMSDK